MTPTEAPVKSTKASGVYIPKVELMNLSGLLGANITSVESLKRAIERSMTFSIAGAEIRLESGVMERVNSRAQASRTTAAEWLKERVRYLLHADVGY